MNKCRPVALGPPGSEVGVVEPLGSGAGGISLSDLNTGLVGGAPQSGVSDLGRKVPIAGRLNPSSDGPCFEGPLAPFCP